MEEKEEESWEICNKLSFRCGREKDRSCWLRNELFKLRCESWSFRFEPVLNRFRTHFKKALEVDQPSGLTYLRKADRATWSTISLSLYKLGAFVHQACPNIQMQMNSLKLHRLPTYIPTELLQNDFRFHKLKSHLRTDKWDKQMLDIKPRI